MIGTEWGGILLVACMVDHSLFVHTSMGLPWYTVTSCPSQLKQTIVRWIIIPEKCCLVYKYGAYKTRQGQAPFLSCSHVPPKRIRPANLLTARLYQPTAFKNAHATCKLERRRCRMLRRPTSCGHACTNSRLDMAMMLLEKCQTRKGSNGHIGSSAQRIRKKLSTKIFPFLLLTNPVCS